MKKPSSPKNFLDHFNRLPPFMVIALARKGKGKGVQRMSYDEIAQRSGMTRRTIHRFSNRICWKGISVDSAWSLSSACGVDLISQWTALDYLNKTRFTSTPFAHLPRKYFDRVCKLGAKWQEEVIKPSEASS